MLIKAEVGLEVSAIDLGGWDTHFAQGSASGLMPNLMKDLAEGLAAFHADMARPHEVNSPPSPCQSLDGAPPKMEASAQTTVTAA